MAGLSKVYSEYSYSNYFDLELPSHWEAKSLNLLASRELNAFVDGPFGSDLKSNEYQDEGVPLVQLNNIRDGKHVLRNMKFISNNKKEQLARHVATPEDIVFAKMADPVARAALVDQRYSEYVIVADCVKMTADTKLVDLAFLIWAVNSDPVRRNAELVSTGTTRIRISLSELKKLKLPYPPLPEQQQIAKFLDFETAKIDRLIERQERLIVLLEEKRQAVISHAVTKGLNPNAPLRPSGIDWLGDIPEHWEVKNYRYATQIYRGKFGHRPRNDPSLYDGGTKPFIQTGDIARASRKISEFKQTLNDKGCLISQLFPAGTLVMAIAANIGDTAILDFEAYAPDSVVGFKPTRNIDLEFLRYSFIAALPALEQTSTQSTQANLNIDRIGAVPATFPPLEEQKAIVRMLDAMLERYAVVNIKAQAAIDLLKERRTALISAAVTGKIDVRDWVEPKDDFQPAQESASLTAASI
ncbi:restriction endonuclease subunit S [Flexibacterium corallicola]|uniref:restriction endonuclease subunit S n=1 Tax=Flexibacterium corallicola TaxID=3037259 RepID=UPI00286EDA46|nr:restriction endonuclease subunit S [Pseudovibrio sp. M1P-2-3]